MSASPKSHAHRCGLATVTMITIACAFGGALWAVETGSSSAELPPDPALYHAVHAQSSPSLVRGEAAQLERQDAPQEMAAMAATSATKTLRTLLRETHGDLASEYEARAEAAGMSLDEGVNIAPWEVARAMLETELRPKTETMEEMELTYAGSLFADGRVKSEELAAFVPPGYELAPIDLQKAQLIVDEHYPELRASAHAAVEAWAQARYTLLALDQVQRSPVIPAPSHQVARPGVLSSLSAISGGWHVQVVVNAADFPEITDLRQEARARKRALYASLTEAFIL